MNDKWFEKKSSDYLCPIEFIAIFIGLFGTVCFAIFAGWCASLGVKP